MMEVRAYEQVPYELPQGGVELILVRHGTSVPRSEDAPFPLLDGRGNPALAPIGLAQAKVVAKMLVKERIDAIYTSSLVRTKQTAAPLAAETGLEPREMADLSEVFLGAFEGGEYRIRVARQDPIIKRTFAEERWDCIPGAEAPTELGGRIARALQAILSETRPSTRAAVFTHGGVIGEMCRQITKSKPFAFIHADNCSISRVTVTGEGDFVLRTFNETAHLPLFGEKRERISESE